MADFRYLQMMARASGKCLTSAEASHAKLQDELVQLQELWLTIHQSNQPMRVKVKCVRTPLIYNMFQQHAKCFW